MEVSGAVTDYTAHMYSIQVKCLVGEKKETSGMRRIVRAAAVAKYRLKFLYTGWDNVILYGEYALDPGWVRHPHGIPQHRVENFA